MKPVVEIKRTLDGRRIVFPCGACCLEPPDRAVLFYVSERGWRHSDLDINVPPGALTFAYYWTHRPYNVYHWVHPTGVTVGFYFNVARHTIIRPGEVEWEDLVVDYWLDPNGRGAFLDEADLPVDLDPSTARIIQEAKADLAANGIGVAGALARETAGWLRKERGAYSAFTS